MSLNQNEKSITDIIRLNGTGYVSTTKGGITNVEVVGLIRKGRWWFMIHRDLQEPQYLTISEAHTGCCLKRETYLEFEDALYFGLPFIDSRYYHFHTTVYGILVKTQRDLFNCNISPQTLAIQTALWL